MVRKATRRAPCSIGHLHTLASPAQLARPKQFRPRASTHLFLRLLLSETHRATAEEERMLEAARGGG
eukprot:15442367-Alexandrium_andersonii.AAC.1